jgi:hypothetical protein
MNSLMFLEEELRLEEIEINARCINRARSREL